MQDLKEEDNATPEELAKEIINWAKSHKMFGENDIKPKYDEKIIDETFSKVGLKNVTSILQNRSISYVGVNDSKESVVVFLEKNLRIKDLKTLCDISFKNVKIEFKHSSLAYSTPTPPPPPVPSYIVKDEKYTCGSSVYIANHRGAGTLGCILKDQNNNFFGLSNNHVLADLNYADVGLPIGVPGLIDVSAGGIDPKTIGHLHHAVPLTDGSASIANVKQNVDAAIFKIPQECIEGITSYQRNYYDTPNLIQHPAPEMKVQKVGRTTGLTSGKIVARFFTPIQVWADIAHINSKKLISFINVWAIEGDNDSQFSSGGDSGSLITTKLPDGSRAAVGLLFAGSDTVTFMVDIQTVLNVFNLEIANQINC